MRRTLITLTVSIATVLAVASPALAQETGGGARPWHYWIAPFLLGAAILSLVALFVGYYVRVMSRGRR